MPAEVEIGVWVEGVQKWVTGVTRRTSCHDIIKALLRAQSLPAQDSDVTDYVLVERWRKVERPLDHEQRILKVWKTWGEAVQDVRFTLRRIRHDGSDSETGSRMERSRRRHKMRQSSSTHSSSKTTTHGSNQGVGNKKTAHDNNSTRNDTMERLMRLVVAQGETIQTQLRRMQERDHQIENFEHQLHLLRVQNLGSDYLLQSYLKDPSHDFSSHLQESQPMTKEELLCEEKSNDSGVVTEEIPEPSSRVFPERPQPLQQQHKATQQVDVLEELEDMRTRAYLLDKLDKVLNRLLDHEEALSNLENSLAESTASEMTEIREEIANATIVHANTVANARQNEQKLRELDVILYQRRTTLESLLEEDAKYEKEALALQAHLDYIIHLPPTAFEEPSKDKEFHSTKSSKSISLPSTKTLPSQKTPIGTTVQAPSTGTSLKSTQIANTKTENSLIVSSTQKISQKQEALSLNPHSKEASSPITPIIKQDVLSHKREITPSRLQVKDLPTPPAVPSHSPPPLPSTSPPPLDEDDKDSGKTSSSLCISSSRSSTSSDSSRGGVSPSEEGGTSSSKTLIKHPKVSTKDLDSTDSNSDTGLSSLHSSSDEGAYVLDTLV